MFAITIATVLLISSSVQLFRESRKEKMSYHYQKHNLMVDQNLFIAAKNGDINLLRDLLNAGYPISNKDKYGKTALHHAVEGIQRLFVTKWKFRAFLSIIFCIETQPLMVITESRLGVHLSCVLELTKNKIQYGHRDNLNRTPLDVAFDISKRLDDGRKPDMQKIIDTLSIYRYE